MNMVDMKNPSRPKAEDPMVADAPEQEDYSYGLRLCLNKPQIEALGLDIKKLSPRAMVSMMATGEVISVADERGINDDGDNQRVEIQIKEMGLVKKRSGPDMATAERLADKRKGMEM